MCLCHKIHMVVVYLKQSKKYAFGLSTRGLLIIIWIQRVGYFCVNPSVFVFQTMATYKAAKRFLLKNLPDSSNNITLLLLLFLSMYDSLNY